MKPLRYMLSTALVCLFVSCASDTNSDDLVLDAVRFYLSNRTNLSMGNMDVQLDRVEYEGDQARVEVTIMAKDDAEARMQMVYQLQRTDGGWEVEPESSRPGGAHGGMPPPDPGSDQPPGGEAGELPEGHPPVGGDAPKQQPAVPEGHPPVSQQ